MMYYWSGAVLHCFRLHCLDLHWNAGFSHTLQPTALFYTAFCALDCTALTCNELQGSGTDLHCILINCTDMRCINMNCTALHCTALCQKRRIHCIGATFRTRRESQCLQYAGFFLNPCLRHFISESNREVQRLLDIRDIIKEIIKPLLKYIFF